MPDLHHRPPPTARHRARRALAPAPQAAPVFARTALAQLVGALLCGLPLAALAQGAVLAVEEAGAPAMVLRASPMLQENIPDAARAQMPVFVLGDRISGQPDTQAVIDGNAELRRADTVIRAQHMQYNVAEDLAQARGQVRINRAGDVYEGSALDLYVNAFSGFFTDARYRFLKTDAHGEATRVDFIDQGRSVVHNATYTTCQRSDEASWQPAWILRAKTIHLDKEEEVGTADGAVLEFKGVPILPIPYITFPLSDKRKSGLLPPTIGIDNVNGIEYDQP